MRLLGLSGSLRETSYNAALLRAAAAACGPDVAFVLGRGLEDIPAFSEDLERVQPPAVTRLAGEIVVSDAILIATPEYNASVPGALKNALDWVSRPFDVNPLRGKPVAVVGASQNAHGAARAQADLRRILRTIGASVEERELLVPHARDAFTADGGLRDPGHSAALTSILAALHRATLRDAA